MTFVTGLVLGLLVGWIIEWVIDLLYWRRDEGVLQQQLFEAENKIKELETALADHQSAPAPLPQTVISEEDNLEKIDGIGPVFAKRLNNAGIFTFAELAGQEPDQIRTIVNPEDWQEIEPERWIEEARQIAHSVGKFIKRRQP